MTDELPLDTSNASTNTSTIFLHDRIPMPSESLSTFVFISTRARCARSCGGERVEKGRRGGARKERREDGREGGTGKIDKRGSKREEGRRDKGEK